MNTLNTPIMNLRSFHFGDLMRGALLALVGSLALPALAAQETPPSPPSPAVEVETPQPQADDSGVKVEVEVDDFDKDFDEAFNRRSHDHSVIVKFDDANVAEHETVDAVVSIGGSSTVAGTVREAVVSIFGNTRVTGPVGDGAVAIFGDVYVNSRVRGDVAAIFGNVELGPEARIGGELVVVSGSLIRDPAATVDRGIQQVTLPFDFGRFEWLRPWIKHCFLYARPLALEPGLGWAWTLAFGFLTLYVLMALMFSNAVEKCVTTIENRPGQTLVASILTVLASPILTVLLAVTVIGAVLIPFFWVGLFIAGLFGKTVILAALGRRLTRAFGSGSPQGDVAIAVVVGGLIVLGLYMVPVVGFIAYKVIGILGLGTIAYTLLLAAQAKRQETEALAAAAAAPAPLAPSAVSVDAPGPTPDTAAAGSSAEAGAAAAAQSATSASAAPADPAIPETALPRAGFWVRMGALLVDMILVGVVFNLLRGDDAFLPVLAAYGAIMWKLKGTTVGGILFNLKIVRSDGRPVDWPTSIVRALSCFLSLVVAGLGFIWIVFDKDRQAWHDKIAGTLVVRTTKGVALL
jgi:uncharacterized RDD family membrane protein YckC